MRRSRARLSEGFLALARREVLGLVIALQRDDPSELALAELRLRWSLIRLDQLIASARNAGDVEAYLRLRQHAIGHLPASPDVRLTPELLQSVIAKTRAESPLTPIEANGLDLRDLDLDDSVLQHVSLQGATLTFVDARGADLGSALALHADIRLSCFDSASLVQARMDSARVSDSDFRMADLTGSTWRNAVVERCVFEHATFSSATLAGARFDKCQFLNAKLGRPWGAHSETLAGVRFTRCDLRLSEWSGCNMSDVTFIDCKMRGIHGDVRGLEYATVEKPVFEDDEGNIEIGTKIDLLRRWSQG